MLRLPTGGWLERRRAYIVCTPLLAIVGAVTTIIAPRLLDPASFAQFALLNSVYLYVAEFDLGLGRLSDRLLPVADDAHMLTGSLLRVRYYLAVLLLLVTLTIGFFLTNWWSVLAAFAGIALMLANGPYAFYRGRSQIAAFTLASFMMQFGLTLPRLAGLLIDGVRGSFLLLAVWCTTTAIVLNAPFIADVRQGSGSNLRRFLPQAVPLFFFSAAWMSYLLINRWLSWLISSPRDAGLFAFGANLVVIGIGFINAAAQVYYPKHLAKTQAAKLGQELMVLLVVAFVGCLIGHGLTVTALAWVFPSFAMAARSTSALLFSGIPLSLNAWLIPLVIARSKRVLRESLTIFSVVLISLYGLMYWLDLHAGIVGQAWACLPPAMLLLAIQLYLVVRARLLYRSAALLLWGFCFVVEVACAIVWWLTFVGGVW